MTIDTQFWRDHWRTSTEAHTAYFLAWTETHLESYNTLAKEHDNLVTGITCAYEDHHWEMLVDFAYLLCRPERGYFGLRGYWREIEIHLPHAIEAAKTIEFWNDWAALQQNLALLYMRQGRMAQAQNLCHDALTIFQKQSDTTRIAETRGLLATIAHHQGNDKQAKTELLTILEIFRQQNDAVNIAITLNQLGQLAESAQEWEQALLYHQEELEIEEQSGNLHGAALAQWGIGNIHYRLGDLEKAHQSYQQAYDVLSEIGDQLNLIRLLAQRANLTSRLGKVADAIVLFQELVDGAQQLGDQLTAYDAMFNLARLYRLVGRLSEAVDMLQNAIQIGETAQLKTVEKDKQALQVIQQELSALGKTSGQ